MSCLFEPLGILSYLCYLQGNPPNYNYNIRQLLSKQARQWDGIQTSKNYSEKLDWKNHKYHLLVAALVLMILWRIILIKHRYINQDPNCNYIFHQKRYWEIFGNFDKCNFSLIENISLHCRRLCGQLVNISELSLWSVERMGGAGLQSHPVSLSVSGTRDFRNS